MGSERRIPAAECTEYPWWAIIDPDVVHGLFSKRQRVGRAAAAITGPFFSRAEAEAQLARRRYAYGPNTVVYSLSGHESADWRAFCHEPTGAQDATARAEAAEAQVEQLRAELERTKMAMATAYTDLPVWSESALAHLSPAERAADEVRAALGRFMQAEVDRRKGAAEAQADKGVSE